MALIRTNTADGVGTLAFDNYAHRNALSAALIAELIAALASMRAAARVVVLRSIAKNAVWSAGHDLHELSPKGQDPLAWNDPLEQLLRAVGDFPAPVIAMLMATPVASPERLEYVERIRWEAYAGSLAPRASTER